MSSLDTLVNDDLVIRRALGLLGLESGSAFSRGSAGLFALFSALADEHGPGEVVVPAICCETVPLAALYAGHHVRVADVSVETLCVTPDTVAAATSPRTRAVVVAHIFGCDADARAFSELRSQRPDVAFVEDIAHAVGARDTDGRPLGSVLDYALLSFARDKILPGDGGLLLGANGPVEMTKIAAHAPVDDGRRLSGRLALSLRNLVHGLADLWRLDPQTDTEPSFRAVARGYSDLIVLGGGLGDPGAAADGFDELEVIRERRFARYSRYRTGIVADRAHVAPLGDGSMCWRATLLFPTPEAARAVTDTLRREGVHASNHYFPLNKLFGGACPVAEDVGLRVVNLWVSDEVSESMIERAIEVING